MEPNHLSSESPEAPEEPQTDANVLQQEGEIAVEEAAQDGRQTSGKATPRHFNADGTPLTRLQIREACKLAYVGRQANLQELAAKYDIPYDTLRNWSQAENWTDAAQGKQIASPAISELENRLVEERERHIFRALRRVQRAHEEIDRIYEEGDVHVDGLGNVKQITLGAKAVQCLMMAEERCDLIVRRNLGMEDRVEGGRLSVNINNLGSLDLSQVGPPV